MLSLSAYAGDTQHQCAQMRKHENIFHVNVARGGVKAYAVVLEVLPGHTAPFSVSEQRAYPEKIKQGADGTSILSTGTLTTGLTGVISRDRKNPDVVSFQMDDAILMHSGAQHHTANKPVRVGYPSVKTVQFQQGLNLRPGETIHLRGYSKGLGYTTVSISRE